MGRGRGREAYQSLPESRQLLIPVRRIVETELWTVGSAWESEDDCRVDHVAVRWVWREKTSLHHHSNCLDGSVARAMACNQDLRSLELFVTATNFVSADELLTGSTTPDSLAPGQNTMSTIMAYLTCTEKVRLFSPS